MSQAIIKFYEKEDALIINDVVNIAECTLLTIYSGSDDNPSGSAVHMFNYEDIESVVWCKKAESEDHMTTNDCIFGNSRTI